MVCNYFVILFGFTSFIVFDTFRLQHNHLDILCCVPAFWRKKTVSKKCEQTGRSSKPFEVVTTTALSCEPCDHQPTPCLEPNANSSVIEGTTDSVSEGNVPHFIKQAGEFLRGHSIVAKLVTRFYSPILQNHFVKLLVVVFFCAVVIPLAIMGCFRVKDGLDLLEVVPEDTEEYGFVNASFSYFTYYDMYVVTTEMNYSGKQVELMMMHDEILPLNHIVKGNGTETSSFWLKAMVSFYQTFYKRICIDKEGGVENFLNQFLEGLLGRGNCEGPLTDTVYRDINGEKRNFTIIPPKVFYEFLTVWVSAICQKCLFVLVYTFWIVCVYHSFPVFLVDYVHSVLLLRVMSLVYLCTIVLFTNRSPLILCQLVFQFQNSVHPSQHGTQ